ncbi:MAG: methionine adenosyltransferase [Candidatus Absconditabacterales bacterium]|nr:methionine adenosyltransferase [Candidatus Absconditabacterales bacterium]
MTKQFITSESVTEGHPDKICDQISDAILDACLEQDPFSRVACECLITTNKLIIAGEITTKSQVDYEKIARQTIVEIGYDDLDKFFDGNTCDIQILLDTQSSDIAMGVDTGGAGDQGMMFGYATNETKSLLPATIHYAHELAKQLAKVRKNLTLPFLLADGKTQVTVEYENDKISRIDTIVVSSQHIKNISQKEIFDGIKKEVILPIVGDLIDENTKIYINPTGSFYIGGPAGDSGLTGRKIIVDTYGGIARHGGGAFSGKDPTKVDRSAAYMARYLAKNIVASGLCDKCEIQLSYAIGVAQPVSIFLEDFSTAKIEKNKIVDFIIQNFDLSSKGIIEYLDLRKPIYKETATYGHFGNEKYSREKLDKIEEFKNLL